MLHKCTKNAEFKQLYIVEGGEHNNTFMVGGQVYLDNLKSFLQTANIGGAHKIEELADKVKTDNDISDVDIDVRS
jgi:hypothetical protein